MSLFVSVSVHACTLARTTANFSGNFSGNMLQAALKARQKKDGIKSVLKEIQPYGDSEGNLTPISFRAMLLRLGLKITKQDNINIAYKVFSNASGVVDVWYALRLE